MTKIRNGFDSSVIAELSGSMVRKPAFWNGNDAIVQIEGSDIRRFGTNGELVATLSGNSIKSSFGGSTIAEIQDNEIRNPFNGQLLYTIDGSASQIEKCALAVTAMILDKKL
ncbi:hypothetical protein [Anaerospora sp.]|uniref:hypothetical protein n=1 Tax=Anaerospora sp. TaxID=1960278 RepID=UPI0028A1F70F|nr:hypothetical protein [Anaerospora sp.]